MSGDFIRVRGVKYRDADDAVDALIQRRIDEDCLIAEAFRDILAGRFDSEAVRAAMELSRHPEYQRLRDAREVAIRHAYQVGASA